MEQQTLEDLVPGVLRTKNRKSNSGYNKLMLTKPLGFELVRTICHYDMDVNGFEAQIGRIILQ